MYDINETIVIALCIGAVLIGTAIMHIAYNIVVNNQKRINKLVNGKEMNDWFLKGYNIGYDKGKSEKSKCNGKR